MAVHAGTQLRLDAGGCVHLYERWLAADESQRVYATLRDETPWQHESIVVMGRSHKQPRLTAWYGDEGARYTYSGLANEPLAWTATLTSLRERIERQLDTGFNSVLLNYYRDGNDAMGLHADDEPELGRNPLIASLSLGASRRFWIRHRRDKDDKHTLQLQDGSLLVMSGTMQHHYKHGVPRQRAATGRINLTFRRIVPDRR